jgi:hypothetical protein
MIFRGGAGASACRQYCWEAPTKKRRLKPTLQAEARATQTIG